MATNLSRRSPLMAAVLALLSAAVYGAGDFAGGMATKRMAAVAVVLRSNVVGLVGLLAALPFVGGVLAGRDALMGAMGGVVGGLGVLLLYQGLASAPMSVVAPITGVLAGVVPVVADVLGGERPSALVAVGVLVGTAAVALVSRDDGGTSDRVSGGVLLVAVGAGLGFGLFFIALDATADGAGLWPVVVGRCASVALFGLVTLARADLRRLPLAPDAALGGYLLAAGVCDAGANALFLLATQRGSLTVVATLGALYPAATVVLAWVVLRERLARVQLAGVGLAAVAIVLVTSG